LLAHTDDTWIPRKRPTAVSCAWPACTTSSWWSSKDSKEAKDNAVVVYVTDHAGTKVPTVGAKGTATILSGKAKATVNLLPDGDNRLKGSGAYASTPDMKAIVSVTLPGKSPEQARFTPLAAATDGHTDHKH
jgi:hypothetical protein